VRMSSRRLHALATLVVSATCSAATAADPPQTPFRPARLRIAASGAWSASSLTLDTSRTFVAFAEDGQLGASEEVPGGAGFEASVQYRPARRLGLEAAFSLFSRDGSATIVAEVPHPLYLGRSRRIEGSQDGLGHRERTVHLDLVVFPAIGRLQVALSGGVSLFNVQTDLVDDVQYDQTYPYDTATFKSVTLKRVRTKPTGWNVGGSLDYRLSPHFGLGGAGRYSRGRAKTDLAGTPVEFDVGGFAASAGLRLFF
jgi:opacity protein-like surface antigen